SRERVAEALDAGEVVRVVRLIATEHSGLEAETGPVQVYRVDGEPLENLRQVMIGRELHRRTAHRIVGPIGRESFSRREREAATRRPPGIEAQHRLMQEGVRVPLVDEAL